jgi:hypothetical protein
MGPNPNDQLSFDNGADFIASSGYVKTLTYTNGSAYAGYFQGGITLTALPATAAFGGPAPNAAAPGSFLRFSMSSLSAPPGGSFGFWDTGATLPTLSLMPGETSTNQFPLSESDGSPGSDPYGHIHGRRFTATKPGIYTIGFRLFDTSTNGPGGGPIHTASQELPVSFQAGVTIESVEPDEDHVHIRFGGMAGYTWQAEATDFLGSQANWQAVGNPVPGNDLFVEALDERPPGVRRFYRVTATAP